MQVTIASSIRCFENASIANRAIVSENNLGASAREKAQTPPEVPRESDTPCTLIFYGFRRAGCKNREKSRQSSRSW